MKLCNIEIGGRSVSGFDTGITLSEFNILLDCGQANAMARQCQFVLSTHGHLDHFGGFVRHAYIRHMTAMTPSIFVVPPHLEDAVHEQFRFWAKIQNARKPDYEVIVAHPGEKVILEGNRFVRAFPTIHRVPSQGYVIGETRKRLKLEFVGLGSRKLGDLRRQGVVFEEEVEVLLVAFTGDTQARVFDQDLEALKAKVLITECTFINGDVSIAEARKRGHVHMDELIEREGRFENNEAILLVHFSHRHDNRDIERAIAKMPQTMRNKTRYLSVGR